MGRLAGYAASNPIASQRPTGVATRTGPVQLHSLFWYDCAKLLLAMDMRH
jgi:hypothetical protein